MQPKEQLGIWGREAEERRANKSESQKKGSAWKSDGPADKTGEMLL